MTRRKQSDPSGSETPSVRTNGTVAVVVPTQSLPRRLRMPSRNSAKIKVATYLVERVGRWVPGYKLASLEVGGSEGLKRLRELRDEGFKIEKRKMKGSSAYEYKVVH
jgi:biotin operon repressor